MGTKNGRIPYELLFELISALPFDIRWAVTRVSKAFDGFVWQKQFSWVRAELTRKEAARQKEGGAFLEMVDSLSTAVNSLSEASHSLSQASHSLSNSAAQEMHKKNKSWFNFFTKRVYSMRDEINTMTAEAQNADKEDGGNAGEGGDAAGGNGADKKGARKRHHGER